MTLSKYKNTDLSSFNDVEVCFKVPLEYHAGLVVKSPKHERVLELLDAYATRLTNDYATVVEAKKVDTFH